MEIKEWQIKVHELAKEKGWWNEKRNIPELLCLMHSEISEALEAYRKNDNDNFMEELADLAIRLFDACEAWQIDLDEEIAKKYAINKAREYRHGGKRC